LIGTLAVACFVKVFGAVFLGTARSEHAKHAHEAPATMLGPMGVLVGCCAVIGLAPLLVAPVLERAVHVWAPGLPATQLTALAPLRTVSLMSLLLAAGLCVASALLWFLVRARNTEQALTWGCGYVAPTPRMQYTSSSFAQMLVSLFGWALRPRVV